MPNRNLAMYINFPSYLHLKMNKIIESWSTGRAHILFRFMANTCGEGIFEILYNFILAAWVANFKGPETLYWVWLYWLSVLLEIAWLVLSISSPCLETLVMVHFSPDDIKDRRLWRHRTEDTLQCSSTFIIYHPIVRYRNTNLAWITRRHLQRPIGFFFHVLIL